MLSAIGKSCYRMRTSHYVNSVAPDKCAATSVAGSIFISFCDGGEAMAILFTPATLAAIVFIAETDGLLALPEGTYKPAESSGTTFCPAYTPGSICLKYDLGICILWNALTFLIRCRRAPSTFLSSFL